MRILVTIGDTPAPNAAARFAGLLAADLPTAQVTLLRVIRDEEGRPRAERLLAEALPFFPSGVAAANICLGHPAEEIVQEANQGGYDLVVVGDRQHHKLRTRFLLGSTAERVIEHVSCPVVVAKGRIAPVRHILLCEGSRDEGTLVDRFLQQMGELAALRPNLTVLHVMSQISSAPVKSGDILTASVDQLIERRTSEGLRLSHDQAQLAQAGLMATLAVRRGLVHEEIVAEARHGPYDLIVLGAHHAEGWRQILLTDVTRQVLAEAPLPVLIVR